MNFLINSLSIGFIMLACWMAIKNMLDTDQRVEIQNRQLWNCLFHIFSTILVCVILSNIITNPYVNSIENSMVKLIIERGIGVSLSYIGIYIVLNLWNKRYHRYNKLSNIWIFVVIFLNEMTAVNRVVHMPAIEEEVLTLAIHFLVDTGMFLVLYNLLTKEKIEKELKELYLHIEQEKLYYNEVEREREAMAKIRHDYNNQLTAVLGLLHMKRNEEAKRMLKEMRRR